MSVSRMVLVTSLLVFVSGCGGSSDGGSDTPQVSTDEVDTTDTTPVEVETPSVETDTPTVETDTPSVETTTFEDRTIAIGVLEITDSVNYLANNLIPFAIDSLANRTQCSQGSVDTQSADGQVTFSDCVIVAGSSAAITGTLAVAPENSIAESFVVQMTSLVLNDAERSIDLNGSAVFSDLAEGYEMGSEALAIVDSGNSYQLSELMLQGGGAGGAAGIDIEFITEASLWDTTVSVDTDENLLANGADGCYTSGQIQIATSQDTNVVVTGEEGGNLLFGDGQTQDTLACSEVRFLEVGITLVLSPPLPPDASVQ